MVNRSRITRIAMVVLVIGLGSGSAILAQKDGERSDAQAKSEDEWASFPKPDSTGDAPSKDRFDDPSAEAKKSADNPKKSRVDKSSLATGGKAGAGARKSASFDAKSAPGGTKSFAEPMALGKNPTPDGNASRFGNSAPPASAAGLAASVPARYRVVSERNLFRKLGWSVPGPSNPFTLLGIVDDGRRKRALLARQGSGMGIYAAVGETVGQGYRIATIESSSVRLTGGALGSVVCQMDRELVGVQGGARADAPPPVESKKPTGKTPAKRYYPARGARFENVVREILEREGISWQEVESNKDLQQKLKSKYQYLEDEGYVAFPKD